MVRTDVFSRRTRSLGISHLLYLLNFIIIITLLFDVIASSWEDRRIGKYLEGNCPAICLKRLMNLSQVT
jgi:hypothetical protein